MYSQSFAYCIVMLHLQSNQASFTCVNGTALSSAADRSCAEWITSGNNASYGPGLATSATAIRFTTPVSGQVLN